jgi:hypothetical protein
MGLRRTFDLATQALRDAQIDHALIGGFALAAHGIARATQDIDFLADGSKRDLICDSLTKAGFQLYHESAEVLQFRGAGSLDILLANRPLSQKMLKDAQTKIWNSVYVLRAEDIIGLKIQSYINDKKRAGQDKVDIQSLIRATPHLDWIRVLEYAALFDQTTELERLKAEA